MKKILFLLFLLLFLNGCSNKEVSADVDEIYCNVTVDKNNKDIIKSFANEKYFICNNLDIYIDYYQLNNNVSDIVREVNVGLYRDYYTNMSHSDITKDVLVLVNKYNYLDENYIPNDLEIISDKCNVGTNYYLRHEARIQFERLCNDAKKDNIYIYNLSGYRSYEKQQKVYNNKLVNKDVKEIDSISARPGNSEHQTGLTVDINLLSKEFDKTNEFNWMINNSYKYGFILRYPKDSQKITGYDYEPWHYRYVGIEHALKIHNENITFDEYYAYYINNN